MVAKRQISIAFPQQLAISDQLSTLIEQVIGSLLNGGAGVLPAPVQGAPVTAPTAGPTAPPETGGTFDTTRAGILAAIDEAASTAGVPAEALVFIWQNESGGADGEFQRTVTNPQGYGGYFGLPASLLGSPVDQALAAAHILRQQYATFGIWKSAICAYNVGPNGNFADSYCGSYRGPN